MIPKLEKDKTYFSWFPSSHITNITFKDSVIIIIKKRGEKKKGIWFCTKMTEKVLKWHAF